MHASLPTYNPRACDSVAVAVEENLRKMESDGYGEFAVVEKPGAVGLRFGTVEVRGENYDIALVRLAGELLEVPHFGSVFMARLRGAFNPSHD